MFGAQKKMAVTPQSQNRQASMTLRYPNRSVARPLTAAFSGDFMRDDVVLLTDQSQDLTALCPVGESSLPSRRDLV
jgi:hypothetical protein